MIPFFRLPTLHWGWLAVTPFTALAACGVLAGSWFALRRAAQAGIPAHEMRTALAWALAAGFAGAHLCAILAYNPDLLKLQGPLVLLKIGWGMSSFGGFAGAFAGLQLYFGRRPWKVQADAIVQGLVVGWIFGRLGCAVAHDHLGAKTDFLLAVQYPAGPRHNLGFDEFLLTLFVLFPAILILHRANPRPGAYVATVSLIYAPARFALDYLRTDERYWGLTVAQLGSIALFGIGLWALWKVDRTDASADIVKSAAPLRLPRSSPPDTAPG